jgi:tRNA(Ile)-lysidine synthase
MSALLATIRRTIADHDLAGPDTRVVAAVSGGSDSMALAHLLAALDLAGVLKLAGFVHFNHQLRASAAADEGLARATADILARPIVVESDDVAARAKRERRSIETAARAARHASFAHARTQLNADVVAVGHTRDDQAETFLLRLVRGAGPRGLAGMYPRNGHLIRPLLDCRRHELRAWLDERGIAFAHDETNDDVAIPRNRVRIELLPLLAARFNPAIVDVLAGDADLARDAWHALDAQANEIEARIVKPHSNGCDVDIAAFDAVAPWLRRVVLWRAMSAVAGARLVGMHHVTAALRLIDANGPAALDAPGQRLERIAGRLVLTGRPPGTRGRVSRDEPGSPANLFSYRLSIPGEVLLAEAGCVVTVSREAGHAAADGQDAANGRGNVAIVRGDLCGTSLGVRNRRPGDRFQPPGLDGRKKLQDFFVDRKVTRGERDRVPLVVDEADRIVWVAGFGIDEAFRVTNPGQAVLTLRVSPSG